MNPFLFEIPVVGWTVKGYGLMLMIGFLLSVWLASRRAMKCKADPDIVLNVGFVALVCGVIGARLWYFVQYYSERFAHRLNRLGRSMVGAAKGMAGAAAADLTRPNQVRVWEEMQGGAVFTEPDIYYQRGAWQLEEGQALVMDVRPVECRYWNVMLYSRFLNSLDHRHRMVSLTGGRVRLREDGMATIVLADRRSDADDAAASNWLDTEGRPFGIFVIRWLKPVSPPALPELRVVDLDTLDLSEGPA